MAKKKTVKKKVSKKITKKKVTKKAISKKKSVSKKATSKKAVKKATAEKPFKLKSSALNITISATGSQSFALKDFKGQNIVIYFYPKDLTPGCTIEGQDFSKLSAKFKKANTVILGVSRDTISLHERFKEKYNFKFELLSDKDEKLCKAFDVIRLKKLYGREYMGVDRSTFIIDKNGKLVKEWRKVKVKGHAEEVLSEVKAL